MRDYWIGRSLESASTTDCGVALSILLKVASHAIDATEAALLKVPLERPTPPPAPNEYGYDVPDYVWVHVRPGPSDEYLRQHARFAFSAISQHCVTLGRPYCVRVPEGRLCIAATWDHPGADHCFVACFVIPSGTEDDFRRRCRIILDQDWLPIEDPWGVG